MQFRLKSSTSAWLKINNLSQFGKVKDLWMLLVANLLDLSLFKFFNAAITATLSQEYLFQ